MEKQQFLECPNCGDELSMRMNHAEISVKSHTVSFDHTGSWMRKVNEREGDRKGMHVLVTYFCNQCGKYSSVDQKFDGGTRVLVIHDTLGDSK